MKEEAWRYQLDSYEFRQQLFPRYVDLDTERHVNNVAVFQLHAEARLRYLLDVMGNDALYSDGVLLRPVRVSTDYLRITHYPEPVQFGVRLLGVNDWGYRLAVGLFQGGACVGIHDCLMGAWLDGARVRLPADVRQALAARGAGEDGPAPASTAAAPSADGYPMTVEFGPRYADMDPDKVVGEAAVARYTEQSRATMLNVIRTPEIGLLVAAVQAEFVQFRLVREQVRVPIGVIKLGNSSFVLQSRISGDGHPIAVARSTMVVFDRASGRPRPMTDAERARLQGLMIQST